eukprot:8443691-Heterocapsa_arctica.AAC.1
MGNVAQGANREGTCYGPITQVRRLVATNGFFNRSTSRRLPWASNVEGLRSASPPSSSSKQI